MRPLSARGFFGGGTGLPFKDLSLRSMLELLLIFFESFRSGDTSLQHKSILSNKKMWYSLTSVPLVTEKWSSM